MFGLIFTALGLLILFGSVARTALTENTDRDHYVDQELRSFPVGAGEHIYRGAFVGLDPAGYLKAFVPGDLLVGIAYEEKDNSSGAAAALTCRVYVQGDFSLTLSGAALTQAGKPVYATDDNTLSLTGHPDAFIGTILHYVTTSTVTVRLKAPGQKPPNGQGSIELKLTGHETFTATGATAGTSFVGAFELKSILGPGFIVNDAEDGGIKLAFDAVAEVALASVRMTHDILPVDKGITMDVDLVMSDIGDNAAIDLDIGLGTALTTNSEADIDHGDMAQLAALHIDGNADDIYAQSDDATTDVAAVDTTINNDSTTDIAKHFKVIVRPDGTVEFWIAGARVLSTTTFAVLSTANLAAFINLEKTSNDTVGEVIVKNLRIAAGCAA